MILTELMSTCTQPVGHKAPNYLVYISRLSPALQSLYLNLFARFSPSIFQQFLLHIYKGLIQLAGTGADASCIYLESFSFSLLYTIEYTHTVLPNFHVVTAFLCSFAK